MVVWTYVLDAYEGGLPSASYLGVLADAAEAADAPDDYVLPASGALPCRSTGSSAVQPGRQRESMSRRGSSHRARRIGEWQTASTLLPSGSRTKAP